MDPGSITHVISASVAPVVVISAAALLCLAFYNRLAAIVTRLRAVQRERLALQEQMEHLTPLEIERSTALRDTCILESLTAQSIQMCRRARLIRATLNCLLGAIASLVICSLLNGLTVLWPAALSSAVAFFVIGMLLLLGGVACAAAELRGALDPAELETDVVSELTSFSTQDLSS